MSIKKAKVEDAINIRELIIRAVEPESNPDFNEEGVKRFYQPNEISAIKNRIINKDYLTLCFHKDGKIIGIITIHENEKIDQLFVDPSYRNKKVSRQLWDVAKERCSGEGNEFWVKSSTIAIPVYESFGFILNGTRKNKNGMTYYPMVFVPRSQS